VRKILIINKSMALDNNNLPSFSLQRSGVCSLFSATCLERRTKLWDFVRRVYVVEEGRKGAREEGGVTRGFGNGAGAEVVGGCGDEEREDEYCSAYRANDAYT
jgi:hypothetical protein